MSVMGTSGLEILTQMIKHEIICAGIQKLAGNKGWDISQVSLWLDFCCIEQDCLQLLLAGVESLRGYISLCDAVLIPSKELPAPGVRTIDKIRGGYGERAWTQLECMSFYAVSFVLLLSNCFYERQMSSMMVHCLNNV